MTVFVVKNIEEWQLRNLWIFLKQTEPYLIDLLVFLIACFIPKEKQLGKNNFALTTTSLSFERTLKQTRHRLPHINTTNTIVLRYFLEI